MDDISYTKHNAHYVQDSALTAEKLAHERNNIENIVDRKYWKIIKIPKNVYPQTFNTIEITDIQ